MVISRCILEGFCLNEFADYMVVKNATVKSLTLSLKWVRFFSSYQDHSIY